MYGLINIQQTLKRTDAVEGQRGIQGSRDRPEGLHFVDRWTRSNRGLIVHGLIRQAGVQLGTRLNPAAQHTLCLPLAFSLLCTAVIRLH